MEKITKFNLEAAFKALDEIEIPVVKSDRKASKLIEAVDAKPSADILLEDFYNVSDSTALETAKDERSEEVAAAKLAKIEKIVDLDAESPDDIQPSYEGKTIIQCPHCMTLFYKNPEDVIISEDDPTVVNVDEVCQHCGNRSGYTIIGKVAAVEDDPAEEMPKEEPNEFDTEFEAPEAEAPIENPNDAAIELPTVEEPAEAQAEEIPENEEEPEEKKESITSKVADALLEDWFSMFNDETTESEETAEAENTEETAKAADIEVATEDDTVEMTYTEVADNVTDVAHKVADAVQKVVEPTEEQADKVKEVVDEIVVNKVEEILPETEAQIEEPAETDEIEDESEEEAEEAVEESVHASEVQKDCENGSELKTDIESEHNTLNESENTDLNAKLKAHNEYIEYLQKAISEKEAAYEKATNEEVKTSIQRDIENLKADLEAALPDAVKGAAVEENIPAEEPVEESVNNSEIQKECEKGSQLKTENETENKTLNEKVVEESVNNSKVQKECEKGSDLKTELETENKTLNESSIDADIEKFLAGFDESCDHEAVTEEVKEPKEIEAEISNFEKEITNEDLDPSIEAAANEAITEIEALADGESVKEEPSTEEVSTEETVTEESLTEAGKEPKFTPADFKAPEATDAEFTKMINSEVFKDFGEAVEGPIVEPGALEAETVKKIKELSEETEATEKDIAFEDIDEKSINESVSKFLTETYANVDNFTVEGCEIHGKKLIIEGKINFKSGKSKQTVFEFVATTRTPGQTCFEGLNKTFGEGSRFILTATNEDSGKYLVTESLGYSFETENSLVEGITK